MNLYTCVYKCYIYVYTPSMGQSNPSQDTNLAALIEEDEERSNCLHDSATSRNKRGDANLQQQAGASYSAVGGKKDRNIKVL